MIRILVTWDREDEIKEAVKLESKIHNLLCNRLKMHSGITRINNPPKSICLEVKEHPK